MLGNQSLSGLDINKHPSNCLIFFLIPPSQLALTNKPTTIRIEQWYHLKKNPGEVELIAWHSPCEPEENTVVWGALFVLGEIFTHLLFFPFSSQHLPVLPPGWGARCCWWWYNNTVRNLWPIPCHLVFCVNHHTFFSSLPLHSPFHRSIFPLFSLLKLPFLWPPRRHNYWCCMDTDGNFFM